MALRLRTGAEVTGQLLQAESRSKRRGSPPSSLSNLLRSLVLSQSEDTDTHREREKKKKREREREREREEEEREREREKSVKTLVCSFGAKAPSQFARRAPIEARARRDRERQRERDREREREEKKKGESKAPAVVSSPLLSQKDKGVTS